MRRIGILGGAALLGTAALALAQAQAQELPEPVAQGERPASMPVTAPGRAPAQVALGPCLPAEALDGARIAALGVNRSDRATSITLGGVSQPTGIVTVGA